MHTRKKLKSEQKKLSRQFEARKKAFKIAKKDQPDLKLSDIPLSKRLTKQIKVVAKNHTKIERIRDHGRKKTASIIADRYRKVAIEEHGLLFMFRNRKTSKSAMDRAIGKQKQLLKSKLGDRYIETSNQRPGIGGNSQTCLCGASVPKTLKERIHECPACGLTADRDHVSANIVKFKVFGSISQTLNFRGEIPATGQVVVRRGEDQSQEERKPSGESERASETSVKRHNLLHPAWNGKPAGGEPAAEGNNQRHRKTLPCELKTVSEKGINPC